MKYGKPLPHHLPNISDFVFALQQLECTNNLRVDLLPPLHIPQSPYTLTLNASSPLFYWGLPRVPASAHAMGAWVHMKRETRGVCSEGLGAAPQWLLSTSLLSLHVKQWFPSHITATFTAEAQGLGSVGGCVYPHSGACGTLLQREQTPCF